MRSRSLPPAEMSSSIDGENAFRTSLTKESPYIRLWMVNFLRARAVGATAIRFYFDGGAVNVDLLAADRLIEQSSPPTALYVKLVLTLKEMACIPLGSIDQKQTYRLLLTARGVSWGYEVSVTGPGERPNVVLRATSAGP